MAQDEIHIGDTGVRFVWTVKDQAKAVVDISAATDLQGLFLAPDGGLLSKDCMPGGVGNFVTDGTDGQFYYDTLAADIDEKGEWSDQGYVELPTGAWHSDKETWEAHPNLTA